MVVKVQRLRRTASTRGDEVYTAVVGFRSGKHRAARDSNLVDDIVYSPTEISGNRGCKRDAAKGIVYKKMNREWHDKHAVAKIEDEEKRELYFRICGDKKPRFMIYIYPSLKSEYLDFKKKSDKKSLREFGLTVEEMMSLPEEDRSDDQNTFLYYYQKMLPVNDNPCVMNRICSRIEAEFDRRKDKKEDVQFDYTIMKSDAEYTPAQFSAVKSLYSNYLARIKSYIAFTKYERVDADDAASTTDNMREEFVRKCTDACPDRFALCNIVLDMCYGKSGSKKFAWEMCAPEIIHNLLVRNDYKMRFPERDDEGDIEFGGERFSMREITVKEEDDEPYIG